MPLLRRIVNWFSLHDAIEDRPGLRPPKPLTPRRAAGNKAEDHALTLLQKRGDTLAARNWSCKSGELDLITWHGDTLVFVEVRMRSSAHFGGPAETVGVKKQERLRRAAQAFLASRFPDGRLPPCRFDIVWITGKDSAFDDSGIIAGAFI